MVKRRRDDGHEWKASYDRSVKLGSTSNKNNNQFRYIVNLPDNTEG